MASFGNVKINQRQLMVELEASDPILKRVADEVMKESFFDPAVAQLKEEVLSHPITQEIAGGVDAPNVSRTLEAPFREDDDEDRTANLWGFIGFDAKFRGVSPESALAPILDRLDPSNPEGPKMIYRGRDKDKLTYRYDIREPDIDAIYNDTPLPWTEAGGVSWAKRVEQGLPGIGHFLNVDRPSSRSGGGIQIEGTLRSGRFRPTSYLTRIFTNFLRRAAGRTPNGRADF